MSRMRGPRRRSGFTLIELLVAITILSVGILALAGTMVPIIRLQGMAEQRAEMAALASAKIGEFEVSVGQGLTPTTGGSLTAGSTGFSETVTGPSGRNYLRRWTVEAGPVTGMFRVTARVSPVGVDHWTDLTSVVALP